MKIGDRVKIRNHRQGQCGEVGCAYFEPGMMKYIGKIGKITKIIKHDRVNIDFDDRGWTWSRCMFEEVRSINTNKHIYWEYVNGKHKKFWAAKIFQEESKYIIIRKWGRIGNASQTIRNEFDNLHEAEQELEKLIRNKEYKGYKSVF